MLSLQPSADRHLKFQRSHEAETVRGTSNFDPWRAFAMRASGNMCGTVSSLGEKTLDTREGDARKQAKLYTLTPNVGRVGCNWFVSEAVVQEETA